MEASISSEFRAISFESSSGRNCAETPSMAEFNCAIFSVSTSRVLYIFITAEDNMNFIKLICMTSSYPQWIKKLHLLMANEKNINSKFKTKIPQNQMQHFTSCIIQFSLCTMTAMRTKSKSSCIYSNSPPLGWP